MIKNIIKRGKLNWSRLLKDFATVFSKSILIQISLSHKMSCQTLAELKSTPVSFPKNEISPKQAGIYPRIRSMGKRSVECLNQQSA